MLILLITSSVCKQQQVGLRVQDVLSDKLYSKKPQGRGRKPKIYHKNLHVEPKHKSVTLSMTQLCHGESLFFNMFWNFTSKSLPLHQKQACISPLQSAEATDPLLTKQWKESQTLPISVYFLFYLFFMLMSCKTMRSKICITGIYISFVAWP